MSDDHNQDGPVEENLPESAFSMRFARLIMRWRFATLMTLLSITLFFAVPLINAVYYNATYDAATDTGQTIPGVDTRFQLGYSFRDQQPEHPYIHAQDKFAGRFGSSNFIGMAVQRKDGDIYDLDFIEKVNRITQKLDQAPAVNHYQVRSLTHINTRVFRVDPDGAITIEPLIEELPDEEEDLDELRRHVRENPGRIWGFLVSRDETAVQVAAGFIDHQLDNQEAYNELFAYVQNLKAEEEADGTVDIFVSGQPMVVGFTYELAFDIVYYLLLTIVMLFFLLLAYFRRLHGVAIPMVAGLATSIWGMGFCAWIGIHLDPLVLVIPLLITARSISHTIQMAERFFEDYEMYVRQREREVGRTLTEDEITESKVETATTAMAKLMLPGMLGIVTDAAGLMVIFLTTIQTMRNLAMFGSFWVIAIIFNVILLHPIMIAYLPPPHDAEHFTPKLMNRFLRFAGRVTTGAVSKFAVIGTAMIFLIGATWYVLFNSTIGESRPGAPIFWPDHEFNVSTGKIGEKFGGLDQLIIFVDGDGTNASANGAVLQRMEAMQRTMQRHLGAQGTGDLGSTISLIDVIKQYWRVNHYNDPKWAFVPDSGGTVGGIIFQLQRSGSTPGALRPLLTDDGQDSNIKFFFRDHKGVTILRAVHYAEEFIKASPMGLFNARLEQTESEFLDGLYYMLGPVLPIREHKLRVQIADVDEQQNITGYQPDEVKAVGEWTTPADPAEVLANIDATMRKLNRVKMPEITLDSDLREDLNLDENLLSKIGRELSAQFDYRVERLGKPVKSIMPSFSTVGDLVDHIVAGSEFHVIEQWDGGERGVTAQVIRYCDVYCPYELWVKNEKFKDASYNPMDTSTYTRGAELTMAGGLMGVYAAVNEEVERGHVANILLIFMIVIAFVGVSYRSLSAGLTIVFALACGTIFSLLYMALSETGLTVQTLPVQSVGVGIGVDYAIYVTDRIRQEYSWVGDLDEGIRRAIRTTGMAVSFTATTLIGGIVWWSFSGLRFQAEMARLLCILMFVNMIGAIFLVPAMFSIIRPGFFAASLSSPTEQQEEGVEAEAKAAAG